jgi:hypothetical protein
VRGHSYNICDIKICSNRKRALKKAVIETPNDYIKIIEDRKKFKVVKTQILNFVVFRKTEYEK